MIVQRTVVEGVFLLELERHSDERGFFARTFCRKELLKHGLEFSIDQTSISYNVHLGTLRGLHFQKTPYDEKKIVRCTAGAIFDVALDLRKDSPTYLRHVAAELTQENRYSLFIPPGVAHGFLTLTPESEVLYLMDGVYEPKAASGVRWNDPAFGVVWPDEPKVISSRDAAYADFKLGGEL